MIDKCYASKTKTDQFDGKDLKHNSVTIRNVLDHIIDKKEYVYMCFMLEHAP